MPHKTPQDPEMPCVWNEYPTMHYATMLMHDNTKLKKDHNFLQITQNTKSGWEVGGSAGSEALGPEVTLCQFYSSDSTAQETIFTHKSFYSLDEG